MSCKNYTIDEVTRTLAKKNDCRVSVAEQTVYILTGLKKRNDLGNGSWGKIDFLINHCKFSKVFVDKFSKPKHYGRKRY